MSLDDLSFLDFEDTDLEVVVDHSKPKSNTMPSGVVKLIRGTMSNISSHIEFLSSYEFYTDLDLYSMNRDEIIKSMDDDHFDKFSSQQYIQGVVKAIVTHLRTSINKPIDIPSNNITDWFRNITTLNWDSFGNKWKSKEGIVSSVDLTNPIQGWISRIDQFAIMKLQQPSAFNDENLLHEIVVGLILNNMRTYLPCFMHTYGGIFCGYPENLDLQISDYSSLCDSNDIHTVLITENIQGNLTMNDFINDTNYTEEDKVKALLMIAFSLNEANKNYSFNHGDLHSKNIMIRTLSNERDFDFIYTSDIGNYSLTIRTRYVPVIIDYGRSSIKYEGYVLTPIEEAANNREIKKEGGLFELWCENGRRDRHGENCLAENLIYKGVNMPAFDFVRLITSLKMAKLAAGIGMPFIASIDKCFYSFNYDRFGGSGGWRGQLKGNMANYAKFTSQTLSKSKDLVNNPSCSPYGFLSDIVSDPIFNSILSPVPL